MVASTINSIVCRRWLSVYFISLFLFYLSYVNGEGSTCKLQSTGNCANAIVVTIDEKSAKEETSFNLNYYQAGVKKVVAVLNYDKLYSCHPTNGYTCTQTTDVTFNINGGCKTLQNATLVGNGKQPVTCIPMENSPVKNTNTSIHTCTPCAYETSPGNSVSHSRQKRCPCPNGNSEVNVPIGLIIGITVTLILAATVVAVVLYRRRKSMFLTRKGYIPKYPHQVNEDL